MRKYRNNIGRLNINSSEEMLSITSSTDFDSVNPCIDSPHTPHDADKMRRKLKFHFMTPCQKFRARRRKPWKLLLQLLKLLVVTLQVASLGMSRQTFVDFLNQSEIALKHIMLRDWNDSYETLPYPAATGQYALYTVSALYAHLDYAMEGYNKTRTEAIGAYGYPSAQENLKSKTAQLCITSFTTGRIFPDNLTYNLDPRLQTECTTFEPIDGEYKSHALLNNQTHKVSINQLHKIELKFTLNSIHIKENSTIEPFDAPDCLHMDGTILYDNTPHNGQMKVDLTLKLTSRECREGSSFSKDPDSERGITLGYDVFVCVICLLSFTLCMRSLIKTFHLMKKSRKFFKQHFNHIMTLEEVVDFVNFWFLTICVSDILTIVGSGLKIAVLCKYLELYDAASMCLGSANLLAWVGVLRYFGYFQNYNILLLTMKKALPDVLKFLVCASVFYFGFTFCGWVVLGPYHVKFQTIATTSECLFSLINGDDMFVTFSVINEKMPKAIWFFSRVYLYSFISLFIYFILGVFISVIIGAYELIKQYNVDGYPRTFVEKFMDCCIDDSTSPLYQSDLIGRKQGCSPFSCCCPRSHDDPDDTRPIFA